MTNMICHKFLYLIFFIFSLLLLWIKVTTSTNSLSHGLVTETARYKCVDKERDALLYFTTLIQDHDNYLNTWKTRKEEDYDCCKWAGVTFNNQTGHVTKLELSSGSLAGKISPSLLNLSYLSYLNVFGNSLNGTIPRFIGSMTQLTYLDLSFNSFSGTIPASIGYLTKLTSLDLSGNYLLNGTCIPQELENLTNLQELSLSNLTSCIVENIDWLLSHISDLSRLDMDGISLAKANNWVNVILRLQKLSYLSLRGCDLSQVMHPYSSSFINSSSSLVILNLDDNNLNSSMYHWFLPLTSNKLRDLSLSKNMLDGESFGNICGLESLDISYNSFVVNFSDFLNNLSGCTSVTLQKLYASNNKFTGSLSDKIQIFSSLEYMDLSHNELNGPVSEYMWELPKLQIIDISSNYLRDAISENIGKSKLTDIDLSNNSLKGVFNAAHMSNLSCVEFIDLSSCSLGPRFPDWIQNLKNLTSLNIASNRIFDKLPVEFWNNWHSQLSYLNLSANNISGKVPDLLSSFYANGVTKIDLSSNKFYGHISNVPSGLVSLDLSRNEFHGGLSFLCQIEFLRYLDLSRNSFTGKLPDCLWHFKELEILNLGYNTLFGSLPATVEVLIRLEVLSLYNNNLSGKLPLSLKNCTELEFLDLGANMFTGNVPLWIGESLSRLYVLSLPSNNLQGPIPVQLCQLANLQILDLSMNHLYGTIPSCVNNFTTMAQEWSLNQPSVHRLSDPRSSIRATHQYYYLPSYVDHAMIQWQGNIREFSINLGLLKGIDLSRNNLTGQIPRELTNLHGLIALNLSNNALTGKIPWETGDMKNLLSLDISRNDLSGEIPSSMSKMNSLDYLDVSYNNLSGRIPSSTQLQSFEPSRYTGNAELCGLPLTKICPEDNDSEAPPVEGKIEDEGKEIDELWRWFYIGGATGFPIGFWIVCGTLLLNLHARHAFSHFLDSLQNMVLCRGGGIRFKAA